MKKPCLWCGEPLPTSNPRARYCSDAHRAMARRHRTMNDRQRPGRAMTCHECGCSFLRAPGRGRPRKYCSETCLRLATRRRDLARRVMDCSECGGQMFRGRTSLPEGRAVCLPCRRKAKAAARWHPDTRACPVCSSEFVQHQARQVYCSHRCRQKRRGYGAEHRRERAKWGNVVAAGDATCSLCGKGIDPGDQWHLDHTPDRTGYRGAAHAACNILDGLKRHAETA